MSDNPEIDKLEQDNILLNLAMCEVERRRHEADRKVSGLADSLRMIREDVQELKEIHGEMQRQHRRRIDLLDQLLATLKQRDRNLQSLLQHMGQEDADDWWKKRGRPALGNGR